MLAVEGQLYDTELTNPITLLSGNLDISFVFIFLLPLLVIALTFNVLSAEQESGVWAFVASQPVSLHKVLRLKLGVKFIALSLVIATLFVAVVLINKLPIDMRLVVIVSLVLAYLMFWFMVVFLVITLKNSSNINAVTLLSSWLFLLVLIPSLSNVIIIRMFPIPEALATTVTQREAYHEKWDMPKSVVMEPFYATYPEYSHYSIPEDRFSYGWYYAMMFAADSEAAQSATELFEKLEKRQRASQWIGYFIPNLFLQNTFNRIAKTDLENHVAYLKSVKAFHRRISEFFYPSIFEMDLPHTINWDELPEFQLITTE
jgi:ABC-2 type transport system permease protein